MYKMTEKIEIPDELIDQLVNTVNRHINIPFLSEDMEASLFKFIITFIIGVIRELFPNFMKET